MHHSGLTIRPDAGRSPSRDTSYMKDLYHRLSRIDASSSTPTYSKAVQKDFHCQIFAFHTTSGRRLPSKNVIRILVVYSCKRIHILKVQMDETNVLEASLSLLQYIYNKEISDPSGIKLFLTSQLIENIAQVLLDRRYG